MSETAETLCGWAIVIVIVLAVILHTALSRRDTDRDDDD